MATVYAHVEYFYTQQFASKSFVKRSIPLSCLQAKYKATARKCVDKLSVSSMVKQLAWLYTKGEKNSYTKEVNVSINELDGS